MGLAGEDETELLQGLGVETFISHPAPELRRRPSALGHGGAARLDALEQVALLDHTHHLPGLECFPGPRAAPLPATVHLPR